MILQLSRSSRSDYAPEVVSRPRRKPRGAYHHGNLREAIVGAATAIVNASGPLALNVRAAAERVGVTHAAVYHHFADREAMIAGVAEAAFVHIAKDMEQACAGATAPLDRYRRMGLAYVRYALRHPTLYALTFGAEVAATRDEPDLQRARDRVFAMMTDAIVACQRDNWLAPGPASLHTLFCWSAVHGYASLVADHQLDNLALAGSPDQLAQMIVDRVFTGLGKR